MNDQVSKIQEILGTKKYTNEQKIKAIKGWYDFEGSERNFDMNLVDSFDLRLAHGTPLTEGQEKALNKIIKGFRINVKEYL